MPYYFDPVDAASVATTIMSAFGDRELMAPRLAAGQQFVAGLPTPLERAQAYMKALKGLE